MRWRPRIPAPSTKLRPPVRTPCWPSHGRASSTPASVPLTPGAPHITGWLDMHMIFLSALLRPHCMRFLGLRSSRGSALDSLAVVAEWDRCIHRVINIYTHAFFWRIQRLPTGTKHLYAQIISPAALHWSPTAESSIWQLLPKTCSGTCTLNRILTCSEVT